MQYLEQWEGSHSETSTFRFFASLCTLLCLNDDSTTAEFLICTPVEMRVITNLKLSCRLSQQQTQAPLLDIKKTLSVETVMQTSPQKC